MVADGRTGGLTEAQLVITWNVSLEVWNVNFTQIKIVPKKNILVIIFTFGILNGIFCLIFSGRK